MKNLKKETVKITLPPRINPAQPVSRIEIKIVNGHPAVVKVNYISRGSLTNLP